MNDWFHHVAHKLADAFGSSWAFFAAAVFIVVWAVTGPMFGFSDAWQLIANTVTNVVTFLMVFIIQNTQNRDSAALHVKLDAVMRELQVSNAKLYGAEEEGEKELEEQRHRFESQAEADEH